MTSSVFSSRRTLDPSKYVISAAAFEAVRIVSPATSTSPSCAGANDSPARLTSTSPDTLVSADDEPNAAASSGARAPVEPSANANTRPTTSVAAARERGDSVTLASPGSAAARLAAGRSLPEWANGWQLRLLGQRRI